MKLFEFHKALDELVHPDDVELTIQYNDTLNPVLWDGTQLRPEVAEKLDEIAYAFLDFLDIPEETLKDVVMTGSNANYNWTHLSDIDLHLVLDMTSLRDECPGFLDEFLQSKKRIWNDEHDINIRGFNVEVYPQDEEEVHFSTGVYSLLDRDWVILPSYEKPDYDDIAVKEKAADIMSEIDDIQEDGCYDIEAMDRLKDKIRLMRKSGLEKAGEFSTENLAFKTLRNNGYLERLTKCKMRANDKSLSLEGLEESVGSIRIQQMTPSDIGQISYEKENEGMFKRLKYFNPNDLQHEISFVALEGKKIVAVAGIERSPYDKEPVFWIKHISVDPEYQGQRLASRLADSIFDYAKKNNAILQRSNYTKMGRERLEPLFQKLQKKYPSVEFRKPHDERDFE
jgi:GNAT superfamily N-acetyltransferase/predicted nucleotidyltransferase